MNFYKAFDNVPHGRPIEKIKAPLVTLLIGFKIGLDKENRVVVEMSF